MFKISRFVKSVRENPPHVSNAQSSTLKFIALFIDGLLLVINSELGLICLKQKIVEPLFFKCTKEKRWFMEPAVISILGGILPFGSIFIEMYFILTSFWAYKIYYVYGFILLGTWLYIYQLSSECRRLVYQMINQSEHLF